MAETFDIWQLNMINCCQFELTFLPIEGDKMLVLLPDGVYLRDFAGMLRREERCFTFSIENTTMLCKEQLEIKHFDEKLRFYNITKFDIQDVKNSNNFEIGYRK